MQVAPELTQCQTQNQNMIITAELRQALRVLELPMMELIPYLNEELVKNPLLEEEGSGDSDPLTDEGYGEIGGGADRSLDLEWLDYFADSSDPGYIPGKEGPRWEEGEIPLEDLIPYRRSLQESLKDQLALIVASKEAREIGEYLIENIDEDGYLRCDLEEVGRALKVNVSLVEEVLAGVIHSLEPPGIGARTLQECLLLQVKARGIRVRGVGEIIRYHLVDLAEGKIPSIAKELGITCKEVEEARGIIMSLDPKPGRNLAQINEPGYIVPDATIEEVSGDYIVIINDSILPRLLISPVYREILSNPLLCEPASVTFVKRNLRSAISLIKGVEERRSTLYLVISEIVRLQRDFLDRGIRFLKPLTYRDVAEATGLHESTVSRAVNGKYVQTPRGIFQLRFFFPSSLRGDGGVLSSTSIKEEIKRLIEGEDRGSPLSDSEISGILEKSLGMKVARRTIAKYRGEMGVPPSNRRKRFCDGKGEKLGRV